MDPETELTLYRFEWSREHHASAAQNLTIQRQSTTLFLGASVSICILDLPLRNMLLLVSVKNILPFFFPAFTEVSLDELT